MLKRNQCKGITLLELLVVLGITALLLSVVPPLLGNILENTQIRSASRHLAAGLKTARSNAIRKQTDVIMTVDVRTRSFSLLAKRKQLQLPDESVIVLTTAKSEQVSESTGSFRFFPDGSSTGGSIKLIHDSFEYIININWLTGKVTINN